MENISVTLSSGETLVIGPLNWGGYVRLKTLLATVLSLNVGGVAGEVKKLRGAFSAGLQAVLQSGVVADGDKSHIDPDTLFDSIDLETVASRLVELIRDLDVELSDATLPLIRACLPKDAKLSDDPPALDVLALRNAVFQVNSLKSIFEAERGFFGRVIGDVKDLLSAPSE